MASGSSISASFGAQLTGQNLPTIGAGVSLTSSQAPSPLSSTPSSQFASNILSELLAAQQSPQSAPADRLQAMGGRRHEPTTDQSASAGPTPSASVADGAGTAATITVPAVSATV